MAKTKREKKGMCLYYSFLDVEFEEMNFEEIGLITTALLQFDYRKEVDDKLLKTINENQKLKILFREMSEKVKFATEKWERLNNNKNETETEEKNKNPDFISAPDRKQTSYVRNENFELISFELENGMILNFYGLKENIPSEKDMNDIFELQKMDEDMIIDAWYYGHEEQWQRGWRSYF